jgi:hypothetical protein
MVGCQEAQHTLKRALHLRCQHGLETHVLFVNLVEAFGTIQHPLLFGILQKYGILDFLSKVIQKMNRYRNCAINCKLDQESIGIKYNNGVQQGDNMSPVLFACIIQPSEQKSKPTNFTSSKTPKMATSKRSMAA